MSTIKVDYLEKILKNFITQLRKDNVDELSFDDDLYWSIPGEEINNLPHSPNLTVGSLNDDIDFLKSLIDENYSANYLELEKLSPLFRFMYKSLSTQPAP